MADQVQWRGGTTAEHAGFTGAPREITVDTDKKTLVVHDGVTAGGHPLARQDYVQAIADTKANINADIASFTGQLPYSRISGAPQVVSMLALPTSDIGPVIVAEASEVWVWVSTPYYTGYRSPLCGRPVYGHTVGPLPAEADAVGSLASKAFYAGLWAYAQENNLVVDEDIWLANLGAHLFVNVSDSHFRVPDLRNQFLRFTGTDADSGAARGLGTYKADTLKSHNHVLTGSGHHGHNSGDRISFTGYLYNHLQTTHSTGSAETAPKHVVFHPRIHI